MCLLAKSVDFSPHDVKTVFFFTTSDNKTHIDYGLRLNPDCTASEKEPLFPYWRDYDSDPPGVNTNGLKFYEYAAYGVASQELKQTGKSTDLKVKLKAFPREIAIAIEPSPDGKCAATPRTTVAGEKNVMLISVYIRLKSGWVVDYVDVKGRTPDGRNLAERIKP
jgi:hypothetical protein